MPRTSLRREIAVRLGSAIALAVLVVAASVIALYLHVNRTVSAQQLVDALAHVRQNIAAFERDLQIDASNFRSQLEFARLLDERDPRLRNARLTAYLASFSGQAPFTHVVLKDAAGSIGFRFRTRSQQDLEPLPDGNRSAGWVYGAQDMTLYREISLPMNAAQGFASLHLFVPVDNALLDRLVYPDTSIVLHWQGKPLARSAGASSESVDGAESTAIREHDVAWEAGAGGPQLTVSRQSPLALDLWDTLFMVLFAVVGVILLCWLVAGRWLEQQTQRLLSLERAVEGFASGQNLQEPVTRQLDVAKAGAHDEVGRLAEGIRQMMQEVVHARESLLAANRSLTSERERIRRIIETSPVGICIYDEPGHCLTTNEAMARHVGATTAQVLALNYHEIEAWTGNGALEAAQRVLDGGHQESLITHATGPFGKEFWLNLTFCALHDNGAKRLMLMTTDISEFRHAQLALEQSEFKYRSVVEQASDGIFIAGPDNRCTDVNAAACAILGLPPEAILGRSAEAFIDPQDLARTPVRYAELRSGKPLLTERQLRDPQGRIRFVEISARVLPSGQTLGIVRDVTERKRAVEEIRELNASLEKRVIERTEELSAANRRLEQAIDEAEQANRAKSAFLATISHEIRTPMNGVIGMIDVLAQSRLDADQADAVNTIRESATALLGIIDDVLDFSKIEAGKLELERLPVPLGSVLRSTCDSLVHMASDKGVRLELYIAPDAAIPVWTDPTRLRQVFYNLVGNAIKFSGDLADRSGRVFVRVVVVESEPLRIAFSIADNGIGIDPDTLGRLFTPFSQAESSTTRRFGGTGMGLAISRRLVELMQGSIHVDSSPGKGSTFVVTLPFERALDHPGLSLPALNGVTCIIVEDTDFSATDLRTFLEPVGARVMIVPDMPSAMRAITQAADTVVIVRKAVDDDLAPAAGRHAPQASSPNVRQVLIRHGRRRSGRLLDASTVLLDVDLLHRLPFMRAIAVAAGKGGKEMLDSSSADPSPAPSQTGLKDQFIHQFILVAEDDPVNRKVIQRQLALLGFDADLAINGLEALDLWRKGRYTLVITDLAMPHLDGYGLAQAIRLEESQQARTTIVALTANAQSSEAARALAAGMDEFLTKPVRIDVLRAAIQKWLPRPPEKDVSSPLPAPIDITVLKGLVDNDQEMAREILAEYLARAKQNAQELRDEIASEDLPGIAAQAHKLKSSYRIIGADALHEVCTEIETLARSGNLRDIQDAAVRFDDMHTRVQAHITRLLASPEL